MYTLMYLQCTPVPECLLTHTTQICTFCIMYPLLKQKRSNITILQKVVKYITKCKLQISYINNISQDTYYQIPLISTLTFYYGVLTIHASNAPFPLTRHQIRMMCKAAITLGKFTSNSPVSLLAATKLAQCNNAVYFTRHLLC